MRSQRLHETRRRSVALTAMAAALILSVSAGRSSAQCVQGWAAMNQSTFSFVNALTMWDPDGPGPLEPVMVAGGEQLLPTGQHVAAWNGSSWTGIGAGQNSSVFALAGMPNGDLVAAGQFTSVGGSPASLIARWNGTTWTAMPGLSGQHAYALAVLPSGDLIAGGDFIAGSFGYLARWDGSSWSRLGAGIGGTVFSLAVLSNGDLIAGGSFSNAGGASAVNIARWNGSSWSPLGAGASVAVRAIAVLPNDNLAVAGNSLPNSAYPVLRWDGVSWSQLGQAMNGVIKTLALMPNGNLVAGGIFTATGATSTFTLARWDGVAWSAMGSTGGGVYSLLPRPSGELVIGGNFFSAGGVSAINLVRCAFAAPPVLALGPQPASICGSGTAPFAVTPQGAGPFTYAWQVRPEGGGSWQTLSDVPSPLACGGSAFVTPAVAAQVRIGLSACAGVIRYEVRCVLANACGDSTYGQTSLVVSSADFNGDGDTGTDTDIEAFFSCLAGNCCPTCSSADFNGDGDTGTDADIESFFRVLAGGPC